MSTPVVEKIHVVYEHSFDQSKSVFFEMYVETDIEIHTKAVEYLRGQYEHSLH